MPINKLKKYSQRPCWLFPRKKNGSLIQRFQTLLMAWGVVVYIFCVAGFWLLASQVIKDDAYRKAELWASKLDMLSAPLYLSKVNDEFETVRRYIKDFPEISYLKLYYANGVEVFGEYRAEVFADFSLPVFDKQLLEHVTQEQLKEGYRLSYEMEQETSMIRVIAPVSTVSMSADSMLNFESISEQQEKVVVVGYIDLGLSFASYRNQLTKYILQGSLFISVLFLMAAAIGRQLIKNALRPLQDLREPLKRLAKGDTDVRVNRDGDEEIAAIGHALNTTINAIKGRDEKLRRLADYDALTGLVNKRLFSTLLNDERQRVIREKDGSALFFIDLDQFKYVNDTLGHASGDRLLIRVAALLSNRMRVDDIVARFGGDEFGVLVKSVDKERAIGIAASIVKALYDFKFIEQGKTFNIYCSVGISLIESDEYTTEEIFSHADMACYSAKSQGRNRFHVYEPEELIKDKVDIGWSHRIADALANNKFQLYYQPIVRASGIGQPSFEVLLRMKGERDELIVPNSFIAIAERFGLVTEIDYWVIGNAMKALEVSNKAGQCLRYYINLSGQLFTDPDFVDRVVYLLHSLAIDASQIVFELTERTAVGDIHNACEKMEQLKNHGFEFAVDDFGSGFSSFTYLKHMPVKYVKIEGEFIERITYDDIDRAMVKSMIEIAKACGKKVIAEYVGDQKTLDLLKHYGADYLQGYYIAKPNVQPIVTTLTQDVPNNVSVFKR